MSLTYAFEFSLKTIGNYHPLIDRIDIDFGTFLWAVGQYTIFDGQITVRAAG